MKQKNYIMKQKNDIIKQPMKNINTMKIMKKFLFLKIFFLALYSPTIFAITCSTGSGGSSGGDSSGSYSWSTVTTSADFPARQSHRSVVFDDDGKGDKMWVIGGAGYLNDVWSSDNGKDWTMVSADGAAGGFSKRDNFSAVVHKGFIWVIGGDEKAGSWGNSVWNSTNGATWHEIRADGDAGGFPARSRHSSVSDGDRIWVIGGFDPKNRNDVWSSTDGVTWEEETSKTTSFIERYSHSSVIYKNEMWVIAGIGNSELGNSGFVTSHNDVWSSANGEDWTTATNNAGFPARQEHQSVVFDNKMWVIAGAARITLLKDVWSSTDGVTWDKSTATVGFSARRNHSSVVFKDKIWIIGGSDSDDNDGLKNDVWSFSKD